MAGKIRKVTRAEILSALADVIGTILEEEGRFEWGEDMNYLLVNIRDYLVIGMNQRGWRLIRDPDVGEGLLAEKLPRRRKDKGQQ